MRKTSAAEYALICAIVMAAITLATIFLASALERAKPTEHAKLSSKVVQLRRA